VSFEDTNVYVLMITEGFWYRKCVVNYLMDNFSENADVSKSKFERVVFELLCTSIIV